MTPEQAAALVARWVRSYTDGLPRHVADRRVEEVDRDVVDHVEDERARGTAGVLIALHVLSRLVRGLPADAAWRREIQSRQGHPLMLFRTLIALFFAGLGVTAAMAGESGDSPGLALIGMVLVAGTVIIGMRSAQRSD